MAAELQKFKNPTVVSQLGVMCVEFGLAQKGIEYIEQAMNMMERR